MMHNHGLKTEIKNQNYAHSENILWSENTLPNLITFGIQKRYEMTSMSELWSEMN